MPYDEYLGERVRRIMEASKVIFLEKKMMGGLIFMVDQKMCCGIHIDKKFGDSLLMVKIGEENYQNTLEKDHTLPMDFTGRPMKGFIFVTPLGFDSEEHLSFWVNLAIDFNQQNK